MTFDRQFLSSFRTCGVATDRVYCFHIFLFLCPTFHSVSSFSTYSFFSFTSTTFVSFSHNLYASSEVRGRHFAPSFYVFFVAALINRFTEQRSGFGPAGATVSSRHMIVLRFKVASSTDPGSPFVSRVS